jgi:hypothetical protein
MNNSLFIDLLTLENYDLICGICLHVLEEPTTIMPVGSGAVPCQHSFCASCLQTWKVNSRRCPICQAVIQSTFPDVKVKRILGLQMVRCPKHVEGCQEVGKLGMGKELFFDVHAKECGFVEVKCDCSEAYLRKDRSVHLKTCPVHLEVYCPFKEFGCNEKFKKSKLEEHLQSSDRQHLLMLIESSSKVRHI